MPNNNPLVIDIDYPSVNKKVYTYSLKNVSYLILQYDENIEDCFTNKSISGNTLTLSVCGGTQTYKFTNIKDPKDINITVRDHGEPPVNKFTGTLSDFCNVYYDGVLGPEAIKGTTLTGTVFDDDIDIHNYENTKKKGINIKSLTGDDDIIGTQYNDTITGGSGVNYINLYTQKEFGNDVVVLTKGEHLHLYIADAPELNANNYYVKTYLNGSNLVIDVYDRKTSLEGAKKQGSVTIKNYTKKDVLTNTGDLFLEDSYEGSTVRDLRQWNNIVTMDKNHYTKSSYTGSWINDNIDASNYVVSKNGKDIDTSTEGYEKIKGVTINTGGAVNNNWAMGSKYADTIKGGAGYDRLYGSQGNDKLYGGAGNDYLNGGGDDDLLQGGDGDDQLIGGAGNDKLEGGNGDDYLYAGIGDDKFTGGKGDDTFVFNANDGTDTITDASRGDTIKLRDDVNTVDTVKFVKNGNNLEILSVAENGTQYNKIIVQNHFKKKVADRVDILEDKNGEQIHIAELTDKTVDEISGSGKINGTDVSDNILGSNKNDTIKGLAGNDEIRGNGGKDTINAGAGKNKIYYSAGDGNDTIIYGGGEDTLVFDSGMEVSAKYSGNNLLVTYKGTKDDAELTNTITIKDYKKADKQSVKYVKIGDSTKSIDEYINGGGADKTYEVNDTHLYNDPDHPLTLTSGQNNKVIFSGQYDDCYITSNNTSAYTDTLDISDISMMTGYNVANMQYQNEDTTLTLDTAWQNPQTEEQGGGYIMYTATNTPKIAIKDSDRTYSFNGYTAVQGTSDNRFTLADGNNIVYIKAQTGTSYVTSNDDINIIKTEHGEHGAGLNYLYGGGQDLICTSSTSNDVYTATISGDTSVVIYDGAGSDTINANGDNVRVVFDCGKTTTYKINGVFIDKTVLSDMTTEEFKNIFSTTKGMNIAEMNIDDGDTLNVNGSAITFDNWSIDEHNVHQAVAGWLTDNNGYTSVADALEKCDDANLLASLKACFVDGTYQAVG